MRGILWVEILDNIPIHGMFEKRPESPHCTLIFDIEHEECDELMGRLVDLHIIAEAWNDRIQAAIVDLDLPCNNPVPHITLSWVSGAKPVESNDMLAGEERSSIPVDYTIRGRVAFFPFR